MSHALSRVTCRGTRTRDGGEVVDDEPARGGVVDEEQRDEPRDEPRDVPRHPDARRSRGRSLQLGEWRRVLAVHDEVDIERVQPEMSSHGARRSRCRATAAERRVVAVHGEVDVVHVEPVRPGDE
jgi:hypothetical protein